MRRPLFAFAFLFLLPAALAHETGEERLVLPPGLQQIQNYQNDLALSVNFLLAFLAGIIGFLSPCAFAVFPAFFAFLFKERKRGVFLTIAFALGILLSFVMMGVVAGLIGSFFNQVKREFAYVSGILLIVFGLMLALNKGFSFLTFRMDHPRKGHTFLSMALLGFFFAWGWTPCVGPILSGILVLAANSGTAFTGALLLGAYAMGVSVPLLLVAFLADRFDFARFVQGRHLSFKLFGRKIHTHIYNLVGGLVLIALGALILVFSGTQEIEQFFVFYTPWGMELMYGLNDAVLALSPLKSTLANIIGAIVLFALIAWAVRALRKRDAAAKFK
jgi:cytochrome c biogenesis protein CcdA